MERPEQRLVFPFHKHLTFMECRKDLIIENDFINQRIKNHSVSHYHKYSNKLKENKLRLAYLLGFSLCFSASPLYDLLFQSAAYHRLSAYLFDRNYLPALRELELNYVNYRNPEAQQLGEYFLRLEQRLAGNDFRASLLATRLPDFSDQGDSPLDANSFVKLCLAKGIKVEDLPNM